MLDLSLFRYPRFVGVQVLPIATCYCYVVLLVLLPLRLIGIGGLSEIDAGLLTSEPLADEVEVVARFKPERFGQDPDPTRLVYGTLGADGSLHVRVCKREPATRDDLSADSAHDQASSGQASSDPPASDQQPPGPPPQPSGTTS